MPLDRRWNGIAFALNDSGQILSQRPEGAQAMTRKSFNIHVYHNLRCFLRLINQKLISKPSETQKKQQLQQVIIIKSRQLNVYDLTLSLSKALCLSPPLLSTSISLIMHRGQPMFTVTQQNKKNGQQPRLLMTIIISLSS